MFRFSDLRLPIIIAPMAGGPSTVAQAAIVANHGGVGSFGFAYHTPEKIREELRAVRALTKGPINANFFIFQPVNMPEDTEPALMALARHIPDLQLPNPPYYPDLNAQLEVIWQEKPEILSFHFGVPSPEVIRQTHELGIVIGMTATSAHEALTIVQEGADFIIAQGIEAGGHRGMFDPRQRDEQLTTLELVSMLSSVISMPIVATGGIMTAQDIQQALYAGATAVQMGTAFLTCKENGASTSYKDFLLHQQARGTALTAAYSGRPARGIITGFMRDMDGKQTLPFPIQNTVTRGMRQKAAANGDAEHQSLWAGMNYTVCRDETTEQLLNRLAAELQSMAA